MIPGHSPKTPWCYAAQDRQADAGNNPGQSSRTVLDSMTNTAAAAKTAAAKTIIEERDENMDAYGRSQQFPGFTPDA
jgi:hypothetical protein